MEILRRLSCNCFMGIAKGVARRCFQGVAVGIHGSEAFPEPLMGL